MLARRLCLTTHTLTHESFVSHSTVHNADSKGFVFSTIIYTITANINFIYGVLRFISYQQDRRLVPKNLMPEKRLKCSLYDERS